MQQRGGGERGAGGGGERLQTGRRPRRPGRDRADRHRRAEQLGQQCGGTRHRQVLHRRGHPGRAGRGGDRAAAATAGPQVVLDHPDGDRRDVEHLPPSDPGRRILGGQRVAAAGAAAGLVDDHLVRCGDLPQHAAVPPRLTAGLSPNRTRSERGAGLSSPSLDGGLAALRDEDASCRSNSAIRASCSTIRACSSAMIRSCTTTSAASCSSDGAVTNRSFTPRP
jgi:hypothetical protein